MKTKKKKFVATKTCLCNKCEGQVFGLLNELKAQASKQKRSGLTLDAIADLEVSVIDGTINRVKERDRNWCAGKKGNRRFEVLLK